MNGTRYSRIIQVTEMNMDELVAVIESMKKRGS